MDPYNLLLKIAAYAIPTLFAITAHEAAHAYIAMKLGDKTAYRQGRVTLNPIPHIDPLGPVLFPILGLLLGGMLFGWAKPVPVDVSRLRFTRKSFVWVALAGPFSNMLMAIFWAIAALAGSHGVAGPLSQGLLAMGMAGIQINMVLMIFNLLPVPPLDGSRVVARFLKGKARDFWDRMEQYGMFILLALMFLAGGLLQRFWLAPLMGAFDWIPAIARM